MMRPAISKQRFALQGFTLLRCTKHQQSASLRLSVKCSEARHAYIIYTSLSSVAIRTISDDVRAQSLLRSAAQSAAMVL